MLFDYPIQTKFKKVLPKSKVYEHAQPSSKVKRRFAEQVMKIVWNYKLSPQTINLEATSSVPEIQVFSIRLRTRTLDESVLRCIDKAIDFPIFYELIYEEELMQVAAYKYRETSESTQWILGDYFWSDWVDEHTPRQKLPVAINMGSLYQQMLWPLLPFKPLEGEGILEQIERITTIRSLKRDATKLETRIAREKQFNRKVDLNKKLRALNKQINLLLN